MKLVKICAEQKNIREDEVKDIVPEEYYFDLMNWLCQTTGYISVWNSFFIGKANDNQTKKLQELHDAGIYLDHDPESDLDNYCYTSEA